MDPSSVALRRVDSLQPSDFGPPPSAFYILPSAFACGPWSLSAPAANRELRQYGWVQRGVAASAGLNAAGARTGGNRKNRGMNLRPQPATRAPRELTQWCRARHAFAGDEDL